MLLGGSAVLWASDENMIASAIAEGVADGSITSDVLTPAQLTAVATSTAYWIGIGLVVTGLLTTVVAVAYAVGRYRTRQSGEPASPRERLLSNSLLGAVATGILSFVPVSPILGGAVAGHLHGKADGSSTTAGAVSGLLAALPLVSFLLFLTVGLFTGLSAADVELGVVVALGMAIAVVGSLLYFAGLGAIGGYLANLLADDEPKYEDPAEEPDVADSHSS
jgi:hypothetical protein